MMNQNAPLGMALRQARHRFLLVDLFTKRGQDLQDRVSPEFRGE
jgi:hypothetical protein